LAARSITLSKEAFKEIAADPFMTAPALFIALVGAILQMVILQSEINFLAAVALRYGLWLFSTIILFMASRILRGKAKFTPTLRVTGFAQSAYVLYLLAFLPVIGPVARFLAVLVSLFAVWVGMATAQQLRGWRTLVLPLLYVAIVVVGLVFLQAIMQGTEFVFEDVFTSLGVTAQP
jgi:hypothetical protein